MSMGDHLCNATLNLLRGTNATAPAAVYVGLFSSNPTDDLSGTEVTTTIRVAGRVAVTFGAPADGAGGIGRRIVSSATVDFGDAAGAVASVTHWGIFDAASAGNLLWHGAFDAAKPVTVGDPVTIPSGQLSLTLD